MDPLNEMQGRKDNAEHHKNRKQLFDDLVAVVRSDKYYGLTVDDISFTCQVFAFKVRTVLGVKVYCSDNSVRLNTLLYLDKVSDKRNASRSDINK